MKRIGMIVCLLMGTICVQAMAQDSYEEWKKQRQKEFKEFKDERDKAFMKMLDETWEAINTMKGQDFYEEPKPEELPKVEKPVVRPEQPKDEPVIEEISIPDFKPDPDLDLDEDISIEPPAPEVKAGEGFNSSEIDFYSVAVPYTYPSDINVTLDRKIDKKSISFFWGKLSTSDYTTLLEQGNRLKKELALNDWGYAMMVYRMGQEIYGPKTNESVLFTWFMMAKAGYRAKVGYDQEGVYLLLPTEHQLFNVRYFEIDGNRYYAVPLDNTVSVPSSIFTYGGDYPDANKRMDFDIVTTVNVKKNLLEKTFSFRYDDQKYEVPITINRNVIAFYELYPLTELDVYFRASISEETRSTLYRTLASIVEGKSETEAVNMILRFVQTAFQYQTDQQQFGREKYLLPEETLFYEYSDCDDRTIMFATLVKEITGLDVVGVRYPRHLATAVKFTNPPDGDYVTVDGKKYTIADPTYVNANIGMTMPQYQDDTPEIIKLR